MLGITSRYYKLSSLKLRMYLHSGILQEKIEAEAKAKKSQRAMANWKKLWRGLEWKKRLNLKYGVSADGLTPEKLKKMHQMDVDSDSD